jgi:CTP:molybdopterin cytidylyltransferase MocA
MTVPLADSPVILLLAAGEGSRFGGAKQLADIAGEPMVRRVARTLLETDVPVLAVTGAYADDVEAMLDDLPLSLIRCEDWQLGMGHSLAAGVRALTHMYSQASAMLVCLADQPLLEAAFLRTMLQRHRQAPDRILATAQNGTQGPPALFPRDCFDALAALSGPQGARTVLQRETARVELFTSNGLLDVDTADDLLRVQRHLANTAKRTS